MLGMSIRVVKQCVQTRCPSGIQDSHDRYLHQRQRRSTGTSLPSGVHCMQNFLAAVVDVFISVDEFVRGFIECQGSLESFELRGLLHVLLAEKLPSFLCSTVLQEEPRAFGLTDSEGLEELSVLLLKLFVRRCVFLDEGVLTGCA